MPDLPSGTITFLFTDIEGSTRLWEQHPEAMRSALARHDALLEQAITHHNGHVFKTVGDAFYAAFAAPSDALTAALVAQQSLQKENWAEVGSVRVRMALHTGVAEERKGDYFGPPLNRVARLLSTGHGGQILLSAVVQEQVRQQLPEGAVLKEMGWHRLKDLQEAEHVYQLLHPSLRADFPALNSLDSLPNNLPRRLTSFIGRDKQIQQVKNLLATTRLLTLIGAGGCGKTRLALQVAAEMLEQYSAGVWLVELAPLSEPTLIVQTVTTALGLSEVPGRPLLQTMLDYLQSRTLLLVLDNCEHLIDACADLLQILLTSCPHLTILATSREVLRIPGEQVYRVPSLLAPDPDDLPEKEKDLPAIVMEYEAPRLFVERARLQKLDFALTQQNASAVACVCHRLDGIPLGIELAAARVSALSVKEINAHLEHRFQLLRGGSRTALPRHQTLQAAIDWSYELLTEQERLLLLRLSVFAEGWTLEAAEKICSDEEIKAFEVLDLLTSLVDKSLAVAEEWEGKSRFRLLETIREYSLQHLHQSGQEKVWRGRHLDYFIGLAEEAKIGAEQAAWLQRLQEEHANLRAALNWCQQEKGREEAGLRLAGALWEFWEIRGYVNEGREYLQAVLSQEISSYNTHARSKALNAAGNLDWDQHDYSAARACYEESMAIKEALGDRLGVAYLLNNLGNVAKEQGDYAEARAFYEDCLKIGQELGDKPAIAVSLSNLGEMAEKMGDYTLARALFEESLTISRALGNRLHIALTLRDLGGVAHILGNYAEARAFLAECLTIHMDLGSKFGIDYSLRAFARHATELGQTERAVRLWAVAEYLREAIHSPLSPKEKEAHDRKVATARASLGEEAFAAAWEQGQAMTLEQAIEYALEEDGHV